MPELLLVSTLILLLAWANGANDVAKGIATLAGSGTCSARHAVYWGTAWTVLGGLCAVAWGESLLATFAHGLLAPGYRVDLVFVASALLGAALWLVLATRLGLPVSTTHALLGGVVGAVLSIAGPQGLRAAAVASQAFLPLLLSPLIAIALCGGVLLAARLVARRVPAWRPGCCEPGEWRRNPFACASGNDGLAARLVYPRLWTALHWLSSGATSFARGLNDTPKIAAFLVLSLALLPGLRAPDTASALTWPIVTVALVMGLGSLWGGLRVLQVLAYQVVPLDPARGLVANVGTASLVLLATPLGLPVSTTHVSAGALFGIRLTDRRRPPAADALQAILLGWLVTFPAAAGLAAAVAETWLRWQR